MDANKTIASTSPCLPLPQGLPGAHHFARWAMHEMHELRRALDRVRIEVGVFVDDDVRPRTKKARNTVMGYVDERIREVLDHIGTVERCIESGNECVWHEESKRYGIPDERGGASRLDAAAEE